MAHPTTIPFGEVAQDGEAEGCQQNGRVAARAAQECSSLRLRHVRRDHRQDAAERRRWDAGEGSGAATRMNSSRNTACAMPATGPRRRPARWSRYAIVPVTQMPPNSADPMLATPCAQKLDNRATAPAGHAVRHDGGSSDFDGTKQREAIASGSTACILRQRQGGNVAPAAPRGCRRNGCRWSRRAD